MMFYHGVVLFLRTFLILGRFVDAMSYGNGLEVISGIGNGTPQLTQIKDSRDYGIAFEANQARISMYLKNTYQGKKLEGFSLPGTQRLKLEYWDKPLAKTSDCFLEVLETLKLSSQSTWDVEISGSGVWLGNGTLLSNVLHRLPMIKSLSWTDGEPIPLDVLQFLEANHPSCQLYYELDFAYWGPADATGILRRSAHRRRPEDVETFAAQEMNRAIARESILNSTNLHSLKVSIHNGGREQEPYKMDLILRILTTCPNIKELDISVSSRSGCVRYNTDDLYAFDFTSSNMVLAPLESLIVDGYLFDAKPNGLKWKEWETEHPERDILYAPWKYLPDLAINYMGFPKIMQWHGLSSSYLKRNTSPLKPGTKTNIDVWLERMDWTHLNTLKIKDASSAELEVFRGNTLPSLRNVKFSGYLAAHHAILDFLANSTFHLESIHFDGVYFCSLNEALNTILQHHASTLNELVIKHSQPDLSRYVAPQYRKPYRYPRTSFLNITHLVQLRDSIPGLVSLDLDILVGEEWDYEILDTLASFSELEYLTLRFEAPDSGWDGEDEDGDEILEECLLYSQYSNIGTCKEINAKLCLMMGLKKYLTKGKVGKPFKKLETWVGSEVVEARIYDL